MATQTEVLKRYEAAIRDWALKEAAKYTIPVEEQKLLGQFIANGIWESRTTLKELKQASPELPNLLKKLQLKAGMKFVRVSGGNNRFSFSLGQQQPRITFEP